MLNWLIPRREALMFLANDLDEHSSADFTGKEMNMISEAIGQSVESHQFWSLCQICFQIASWGANVSRFFHSCPIPSHFYSDKPCQCQWKGRMSVRLAQGCWIDSFSQELMSLPLGQAKRFLVRLEDTRRLRLEDAFNSCKTSMVQRLCKCFHFGVTFHGVYVLLVFVYLTHFRMIHQLHSMYRHQNYLPKEILDQWDHAGANHKGNQSFHMGRFFAIQTSLETFVLTWSTGHLAVVML